MKYYKTSEKKQLLIDKVNGSEIVKGDCVFIKQKDIPFSFFFNNENSEKAQKEIPCIVTEVVEGGMLKIKPEELKECIISKNLVCRKNIFDIGENPFVNERSTIRPIAYSLDSIVFTLDIFDEGKMTMNMDIDGFKIKELNWNPFVFDKEGNKQFYQRPFVWTVEDKQLLIESIYNGVDCGKILVRNRSFEELRELRKKGETDLFFKDLIDGKQRLNAIKSFMEGEFADLNGNFFSDLSNRAQHLFMTHQLFSYSEMSENTTDEEVIVQFLKLNFTGVPQSKEHIAFIKELKNKI